MSSSFTKNVTVLRRKWEQDAVEVKLISLSVVGMDKTEMVNFVKPDDDTTKAPNIRRQPFSPSSGHHGSPHL